MKCTIENPNLKTWSRVIQALSITGDQDIYFSFTDSTLTLTAFGSSLEVCVTCTFFRNFFLSYDVPRNTELMFRVPSKCILKPFRSMRFLTKCCTFCKIEFEIGNDTIVVTMGCRSGAEIRYTVDLAADSELMQIEQDPDSLKNWIKTEPKLIIGSLSNFAHSKGLNDLTLQVKGNKVFLKNCMTELVKKDGRVYTEFLLNAVDFVEYNIQEDSELTFGLRELKNFAGLAEHMKLPFSVHFQGAADPVVFVLKSELLESNMILATKVLPVGDSQCTSQSSIMSNGRISNASSEDPKNPNMEVEAQRNIPTPIDINQIDSEMEHVAHPSPPARPSDINQIDSEMENLAHPTSTPGPDSLSLLLEPIQPDFGEDFTRNEIQAEVQKLDRRNKNIRREIARGGNPPPRKRLRNLFPNIGQPFDVGHSFPGHDVVLAAASDEEDTQ